MPRRQYPATHNILKAKWLKEFEDPKPVPEPEPEPELDVDFMASLLADGHTFQTEESDLNQNPSTDVRYCPHKMVSRQTLKKENYTSLYEQFCPMEPGPWSFTFVLEDYTEVTLGYDGLVDTSEMYPDRWDVEYQGYSDEQHCCTQVERTVGRKLIQHRVDARNDLFGKILSWVETASLQKVRASKGRFWRWVLASRAACANANLWTEVCLTKKQVTDIFAAYSSRLS